ncbi:8-amino-7-oxononanoate synthase [Methylophaga sp. UBA4204]|uniref:8-amino-7-oxononanoate synthase n=1 Tax=Methylophaga sp. UBA4204 TaxID=1946892 RepID=UPI0025CDAFD4|nr:8-amino-7-oxononanoate synthase [Methylophaga sp. UBA4204]
MSQLPWHSQLQQTLTDRKAAGLYRRTRLRDGEQGVEVVLDGRKMLSFSSNDYLGLAAHPALKKAFIDSLEQEGVGSGAAHLLTGHSRYHHQLEEALAEFTGQQRVLLFSTGYMANMGAITALVGQGDGVFEDRLNHASLLDAGLLSGARFQRFLHNDLTNLQSRLEKTEAARKLIVVDGVFSMDGDCAPLPELAALAQKNNAWLMVDDAHGFGCLGKTGAGCGEHFGLNQEQLPILMGTLGKAAGSFGAFIAGSETLIETLIQFARPYIYTTAMPPAVAAATRASLRLIQTEQWRREHLNTLIAHFRAGVQALNLQLMDSFSPIQPIVIGDEARALSISQKLAERGILIIAIRPPTVPVGSSRLRITFSAQHTIEQVDQLLLALADIMGEVAHD